ncbi:hypothetical protein CLAIMM_15032 [Cladophialophora immunda]|nr:hypothetical protein CLAIMM_15032 [Cladophialophora immunda]
MKMLDSPRHVFQQAQTRCFICPSPAGRVETGPSTQQANVDLESGVRSRKFGRESGLWGKLDSGGTVVVLSDSNCLVRTSLCPWSKTPVVADPANEPGIWWTTERRSEDRSANAGAD